MQSEDVSALVDRYGTAVYRLCHKLTGNIPDADDLYQETYMKAFEQCRKINPDHNPKAFLCCICVRLWKSNCRKYARRQRLAPCIALTEAADVPDIGCVEETVLKRAEYDRIRAAVNILGDKHRIPVYLFYTLDMGVGEIADVLKIPAGTVKSRLHKARALIQLELEEVLDEGRSIQRSIV